MRGWLLLLVVLAGCPEPKGPAVAPAPRARVSEVVDAGVGVTPEAVEAWLRWQQAVAKLPPLGRTDGGTDAVLARARQEAALLKEAGLTSARADEVEAVVAAVVAERAVARLTGAQALEEFQASLAQLAPERRAKAEAAFAELKAKTPPSALTELEGRFGADAVRAVLTREEEVTKTWDTLLDARGD